MARAFQTRYIDGQVVNVWLCRSHLHARCVFRRDFGSLTFDVPASETSAWRAVARVLRSPVDAVSCAFLPASCFLCSSPLPHLSSAPICDACWTESPSDSGSVCSRCGDSLEWADPSNADNSRVCRACRLAPPSFERAVAYRTYEGRLRELVHALKYGGMRPAARELGRRLAGAIASLDAELPKELLVVPVPLHRTKQAGRGFNQALLLAEEAVRALRSTHPDWSLHLVPGLLIRTHATDSQAGLTPRQRRQNLRRAFAVRYPKTVDGRDVLLIDDILTTGATARAASRALIDAGAAKVWVATLARARHHIATRTVFSTTEQDHVPEFVPGRNPQLASQHQPSF